jgi:hypothetical protein
MVASAAEWRGKGGVVKPRISRFSDRLEELAEEGNQIATSAASVVNNYVPDETALHSWLVKVRNLIESVFGRSSAHFRHLEELTTKGVSRMHEVQRVAGVVVGAKDDLDGGYLIRQEMLVAGAVFDSLLDEAKHFLGAGFDQCAAVLSRVVLEDALRRIARREGVDDSGNASAVNDRLKAEGVFTQPRWRQVQSWLDVGNAAAHGNTGDFDADLVRGVIEGLEQFLAQEL